MAPKQVSLNQLVKDGKPVYVKNNSKPKGLIVLNFTEDTGRNIGFQIPPTFIPLCLSDVIPADSILRSTSLRESLYKKVVILIDPEDAERELMSAEAQEELNALSVSVYSDAHTGTAIREQMERSIKESQDMVNPVGGQLSSAQPVQGDDIIDPKVKAVLLRLDSKEISSKEALSSLRRMKDDMSMDDLSYVVSQIQEGAIKKFAMEALAEKRNPEKVADTRAEVVPTFKKSPDAFDFDNTSMTPEEIALEKEAIRKQSIDK